MDVITYSCLKLNTGYWTSAATMLFQLYFWTLRDILSNEWGFQLCTVYIFYTELELSSCTNSWLSTSEIILTLSELILLKQIWRDKLYDGIMLTIDMILEHYHFSEVNAFKDWAYIQWTVLKGSDCDIVSHNSRLFSLHLNELQMKTCLWIGPQHDIDSVWNSVLQGLKS